MSWNSVKIILKIDLTKSDYRLINELLKSVACFITLQMTKWTANELYHRLVSRCRRHVHRVERVVQSGGTWRQSQGTTANDSGDSQRRA